MKYEELFIVLFVLFAIVVIFLLHAISKLMDAKRRYYDALRKKENAPDDVVTKVNVSATTMKLIETLVSIEIDSMVISLNMIKKPYDMLRLDKDAEYISQRVFKGIKPEIYRSEDQCLTEEYLLQFITTEVMNKFIQAMITMNTQLYISKAENDSGE